MASLPAFAPSASRLARLATALVIVVSATASAASDDLFRSYFDAFALDAVKDTTPRDIVAVDLNHDGHIDIATANHRDIDIDSNVTVLLSDGAGGFESSSPYLVGGRPDWIDAADVNGDGHADLITSNVYGLSISILINQGDGTFLPAVDHGGDLGCNPHGLAMGDMDGDGDIDAVTATPCSFSITIFTNDGAGAFTHFEIPTDTAPRTLDLGDLDSDGDLDVAIVNEWPESVTILVNDGSAGFPQRVDLPIVGYPGPGDDQDNFTIATSDVDGDGDSDVIACSATLATAYVLENLGGLAFAEPVMYDLPGRPIELDALDLTGDDRPDLVFATRDPERLTILPNLGDGTFGEASALPTGTHPFIANLADVDGDGRTDVLAATFEGVAVHHNLGAGSFPCPPEQPVGAKPIALVTADLDGDGRLDVVTLNEEAESLTILLGNGDGTFTSMGDVPPGPSPLANPEVFAIGDLDGDGWSDILVEDAFDRFIVLRNLGGAAFEAAATVEMSAKQLFLRDLDADGWLDVIASQYHRLYFHRNDGDLTFTQVMSPSIGATCDDVAIGDTNGDGEPDSIGVDRINRFIACLTSDGEPLAFNEPVLIELADPPVAVELGDVNRDGRDDIVVLGSAAPPLDPPVVPCFVLLADQSGGFASPVRYNVPKGSADLQLGDVDHDGDLDIVTGRAALVVLLNEGDGTFAEHASFMHGRLCAGLALADLDNDADLDALRLAPDENLLIVIPNLDCPMDLTNDGAIGMADLQSLLGAWGVCPGGSDPCPADLTGDGAVNADDLFSMLGNWGACEG